jgi:glycosyltransferase involved in cell wall biosynthesis
MQSEPKLTIIIPAYNEETSLQWLIPEVIKFCKAGNYRLIAVNDASTDNTAETLSTFQAIWDDMVVITHKINRGYGGALASGISRTTTP